ncbi:hypothetical protein HOY80DRAFT_71096 [Tuber brumale]|nr:hypothetical protein HOY80DRAFT_71096 [Tuber brumale]
MSTFPMASPFTPLTVPTRKLGRWGTGGCTVFGQQREMVKSRVTKNYRYCIYPWIGEMYGKKSIGIRVLIQLPDPLFSGTSRLLQALLNFVIVSRVRNRKLRLKTGRRKKERKKRPCLAQNIRRRWPTQGPNRKRLKTQTSSTQQAKSDINPQHSTQTARSSYTSVTTLQEECNSNPATWVTISQRQSSHTHQTSHNQHQTARRQTKREHEVPEATTLPHNVSADPIKQGWAYKVGKLAQHHTPVSDF